MVTGGFIGLGIVVGCLLLRDALIHIGNGLFYNAKVEHERLKRDIISKKEKVG